MCTNLNLFIIILLLSHEVLGKNASNTKSIKNNHKKTDKRIGKLINERSKRSLTELEKAFLSHLAHGLENDRLAKFTSEGLDSNVQDKNIEKQPPFWGTRGRRDSSSESTEYSEEKKKPHCKYCDKFFGDFHKNAIKEELDPFWFERGVKDKSKELDVFWGNPGKREETDPFWGNRGRRDDMEPFWGNRGRRDEAEPFWGNRGRRDETEPFWGNRGRRDEVDPFWGNRGRRDENEPFWGNRGRRQETDPFWGTRGRRETKNSLHGNFNWGNQEKKKEALKYSIIDAMDDLKHDVVKLARIRRAESNSFWNNRGRDSKLGNLFKEQARNRNPFLTDLMEPNKLGDRPAKQNTVLEEKMYAEQPHYILIERSSRSSSEDDPFFISRGKKYTNSKLSEGIRDRRGVLEELVKSVRTDPYYIARGKKDSNHINIGNSSVLKEKFIKAKELICSAIDMLGTQDDGNKIKRDIDESERDRRTILKKLAAQLQIDPYFVSRGKKNGDTEIKDMHLEEFINHVSNMCT